MTLSRGSWVKQNGTVGLTAVELRRVDAACYYQTTPGTVRSGVLWVNTGTFSLVTARADMSYDLQPLPGLVIGRAANEGAYTLTTQGVTNIATGAAPAAGLSRWDLIWLKQNDMEKGDADNLPVLGVTQGTAASTPTKPTASVPVGAYVLAEAQIFSGTTGTNGASNTLKQLWLYTALVGEPVPVRNNTERPASPRYGDQVKRLDITGMPFDALERWSGSAWQQAFAYAEYFANSFAVAGGLVNWDAGPMSLDTNKNWNNSFSNTSGALSGAVNITETGLYAVSFLGLPRANPGRAGVLLKYGGGTLASGFTDGAVWEESASFVRHLAAGTYVRATILQANSTTNDSVMCITKLTGVWSL